MIPLVIGPEWLKASQLSFALFIASLLLISGVMILAYWVPRYESKPAQAKEHVKEGHQTLICAGIFAVGGFYIAIPIMVYFVWDLGKMLIKSIQIARRPTE